MAPASIHNGSSGTFLPVKERLIMASVTYDQATRVYPGADTPSVDSHRIVVFTQPESPVPHLVLDAVRGTAEPMSAGEVAAAIGISRATAQRYLATLVSKGRLRMQLRYGSTGRPEQEYSLPPGA